MPFDPKLIHADEPPLLANGDLNLPLDLAPLAEQLAADASHLAACYPAAYAPALPPTQLRIRTRTIVASAFAASLAVLLAGFIIWQGRQSNPQKHSPGPSPSTPLITSAAPSDATISLTDLSSPEVEALLDLMERAPDSTIRVSF